MGDERPSLGALTQKIGDSVSSQLDGWADHGNSYLALESDLLEARFSRLLSTATDINEFAKLVANELQAMGFEHYSLARLTPKEPIDLPFQTVPMQLYHSYEAEGFFDCDFVLDHAMRDTTPLFKATVERSLKQLPFASDLIKRNLALNQMLDRYGFFNWYYVPVKAAGDNGCVMLALTAMDAAPHDFAVHVQKHSAKLHALVKAMDYVGTAQFPNYFLAVEQDRDEIIPSESLEFVKTMIGMDVPPKQLFHMLRKHRNSMPRHFRALREALNVRTNPRVIYELVRRGLINLD